MNPIITIGTVKCVMKVELYLEVAPNIVRNFLSLVEKGFYDDTIFHRVIPGFMIQGGDPEGIGMGGPDYHIRGEFAKNSSKNDLKHTKGVISMARASCPDGAGPQLFLMAGDAPYLDGDCAAFGEIIEGLEEVDYIVGAPRDAKDRPREDRVMKKITAETPDVEHEGPETLPL